MSPIMVSCSREFRCRALQTFPGLKYNSSYWNLFLYLCFGNWREEDTHRLILSNELLASFEGKEDAFRKHTYRAEDFLLPFRLDVLPTFQWGGEDYQKGLARVVTRLEWPQGFSAVIEKEQQGGWRQSGLVFAETGQPATPPALRERHRERARETYPLAHCADARQLLEYLNQQPSHRFSQIMTPRRLADAEQCARAQFAQDPTTRDYQLHILHSMCDQPVPIYKATQNSARIYPVNPSLLTLARPIRRLLTEKWPEADLKSCQFAIAARDWNVPLVQDLLARGICIWDYLFQQLGLPATKENKGALKRHVYASLFGMGKRKIRKGLEEALGIQGIGNRFLAIPAIAVMLGARDAQIEEIVREGGRTTCYGRDLVIPVPKCHLSKAEWHRYANAEGRSILAQCAQALELQLLSPVIQAAMAHQGDHGFSLLLWQHDGFSIVAHRQNETKIWINRLSELVAREAAIRAIHTELEWVGMSSSAGKRALRQVLISTDREPLETDSLAMEALKHHYLPEAA